LLLGRRAGCAGLLALLAGCVTAPSSPLSPQDRADVARIQSYLDGLHGLRARFLQVGPDRGNGAGTVWYDPGRLRLDYDTPGRMVVVAAGGHLVAHRETDDSTTRIALSGNPLGLLLARPLRLSGAIGVTDIQRTPGILQASLTRAANPGQGLLTLIFSDGSAGLGLIGLEAVDARRQRTRFHLTDVQTGLTLAPQLFTPPGS
jgi:outer membrane lipoprotein-sorting protein